MPEQSAIKALNPEDAAFIDELSKVIDIHSAKRLALGHEDKFRVINSKGEKLLLRINGTKHYNWLEGDFRMYKYVADKEVNISRPVSMGKFREGSCSYQLYTWLDGSDLLTALSKQSEAELYLTGVKAGKLMRKLHSLAPMSSGGTWFERFSEKAEDSFEYVRGNPDSSKYGEFLMNYVRENLPLVKDREMTFTHGDWNPENLIYTDSGEIGIIDLSGENDRADPWWEFRDVLSDAYMYPAFYTGQINGYFDGNPPIEFFKLLSIYVAQICLEYLSYREEGDTSDDTVKVMKWFDNMRNPVPTWYTQRK